METIKANELRIGNLVNWGVNQVSIKSIHTESVLKNKETILVEVSEKLKNYCLDINEIQPIKLTEDWFLKLGFIFNIDYYLICNSFNITFEKSGNLLECFLESVGIEIYYVHQLQNLYFALTGNELTIA